MKKTGLGLKIMIFTILLVVITAVILIYFSYITSYADLEKAVGERLEAIAATGALMIDGDLHDRIKGAGDENSEAFIKLKKVLLDIKKRNNLETEVYTLRREGNKIFFAVMTNPKPYIGQEYEIREEMLPALNQEKSSRTKIYKNKNGTWLTAYAPIYDSGGHISAVLGVDTRLTTFQQQLREKVRRLAIISIIILGLGIVLGFLLSRRLVKNLGYLTEVTRKISTGMMDRSIKVESRDEVGELAESLERMRVSLKIAMDMISEKEEE
jgi:methyl-accepting chemotaxis protein